MRRIVFVAAVCASACAGVSGLTDYTVVPDDAPALTRHPDGTSGEPADAASGTPAPDSPDSPDASDASLASLAISPSTIPSGTIMLPYAQTFVATGGESPYAFRVAQGSLPVGLALTSGGVLSGTPTASGTTTFTVAATDARGWAGERTLNLDIAASHEYMIGNGNNVVLATVAGTTAAQVGSFVFTIESGMIVGSADATQPALMTGNFQPGSLVTLVNKGSIQGMGGAGGTSTSLTLGGAGSPGGAAISLAFSIRIDNAAGMIFGGGGGGGSTSEGWLCGGGGGQGSGTSAGGAMPRAGGSGGPSGPGPGATDQSMHSGAGGGWAAMGETATSNTAVTGGKGGAGGAAVIQNGHSVDWIGGNTTDRVKGMLAP